ncbi:hypothetical protein GWI33_001516 [Rhynchophorus ferrugineus]|uniref:Calponin-homology (CH) domain-containing protein n=1 Tax=Rhynchophorus ferrugineus TaxID=354439 RepID=A0A834MGE4_RHYFE|nr:hypothetical protein GWI33_001516 [Rhynchophorus ferrugineus]
MSTQNYYKEKLGFDPRESIYHDGPPEKFRRMEEVPHGYEENLTKFKGTMWDLFIQSTSDERDAVQKKTFTKWVNKHLIKAKRSIRDLFEDLRDGHNLISLLEVLTGETLPREKGQMRFHMLHNIDTALHFLRCKNVKLVNIRSEDIVDGNPKLTLGLIWTIILHFQGRFIKILYRYLPYWGAFIIAGEHDRYENRDREIFPFASAEMSNRKSYP